MYIISDLALAWKDLDKLQSNNISWIEKEALQNLAWLHMTPRLDSLSNPTCVL